MIKGVMIERGFPTDEYSTYVRCYFEKDIVYDELLKERPLTDCGLQIYELYNLLERVENALDRTIITAKKMQLEEYKNSILELINILNNNSIPVRDDDECFEGKLKIPYLEYKRYVKVNTFKSKSEQRNAIKEVNKTLKMIN